MNRRLVTKTLFLCLPILGLFGLLFFLPITVVTCQSSISGQCSVPIQQVLSELKLYTLFNQSIQTNKINSLVEPAYTLHSYQLVWPNQINLVVKPNTLAYQLIVGDKYWGITTDGKLVDGEKSDNLIAVSSSSNIVQNGQVDAERQTEIIKFISLLQQKNILVKKINWQQHHNSTLIIASGQTVLFDETNLDVNIARLASLLQNPNLNDKLAPFNTIDVRFRLPVLRK